MTEVIFTVPGKLAGKGRPKFARRGKFVVAYTPEKTRNVEAMVKDFASQAMAGRPLLEGPLYLKIHMILMPPVSWSNKKRLAAKWVVGKPDWDNIAKLIGDSFNGIVWQDDSQIAKSEFSRIYSLDKPEQTVISVLSLT